MGSDESSDEIINPEAKRQRVEKESALFQAYRALGYYTSQVPIQVFRSQEDTLIASVVGGHAFYVFNAQKLNLVYMSRYIAEEITAVQVLDDGTVFTVLKETNTVQAWNKMHRVRAYTALNPIKQMLCSTSFVFCLQNQQITVWQTQTGQEVISSQIDFDQMMHPVTYLNKLVLWKDNTFVLYNVMENKQIYSFKPQQSHIETIVQTPVVNVVAVGLKDGSVNLINLLYDELLFSFKMQQGSVNQISFLTDSNFGVSLMATASRDSGVVVLWDLNQKKIWTQLKIPHSGRALSSVAFIPNEPVLVTASEDDNSIKMWLFEKGQSEPRLLRERTGHAEAPTKIRFYGGLDDPTNHGARNLITCSTDGTLRDISLLNELQSMNFSQKKQLSKMNDGLESGPIKAFDCSQFRERDWQNIVTCHNPSDPDAPAAPHLWSYANHSISKVQIQSAVNGKVTSVAVTLCGNFGVLGFKSGMLTKFNLQSGIDRGLFKSEDGNGMRNLHSAEVTGLGIDSQNKYLVSGSMDKSVKLWDFYRAKLLKTFDTEYPIANLCYNRFNDLVAISTTDLTITLLNAKTGLQKVRQFAQAANNKITDLCFSQPDQRWLICSSLDRCIRVWDIVTGSLIDWLKFKNAPLSIDFSPSGEFLATSHLNSKAVYLWSNRTFFSNTIVQKVPRVPTEIDLPDLSTTELKKRSHSEFYNNEEVVAEPLQQSLIESKLHSLVDNMAMKEGTLTLSDQPFSKFQAIFQLEQIKARNKPDLAKQALPQTPFFLFDLDKAINLEGETTARDFLKETFFTSFEKKRKDLVTPVGGAAMQRHGTKTQLVEMLGKQNTEDVLQYLKRLTPSGVELEVMTLANYSLEGTDNVNAFLDILLTAIKQKKDTDYVHALLNCCLKVHYDDIVADQSKVSKLKEVRRESDIAFTRTDELLNHNICMISAFTGVQMTSNSFNL